jgi:thiol-disulfide isomerase/thioredoxin
VLRFHTRAGCTLCEKAWPVARELATRYGLELVAVDVGADPELEARYGERIPVLVLDGRELGWGRLSARALERELARARAEAG